MTAPDPTAGERACRYPCDCGQFHDEHCACMDGHALPAVAASTGTSEDVEAWAEEHEELARIANALHDGAGEYDKGVAAGIRLVLASDWLAAREAAARAEERERIAQAIEGVIEAHRSAGNRAIVAALAPLPDLAREVRP